MSLDNKNSLGIAFIMIGREATIDPLFNYLKEVKIPSNFTVLNLNIVQSFDSEFKSLFDNKVIEYDLGSKYNINLIDGVDKVDNELEWKEWEEKVRFNDPYAKHYSTAVNLTKAIDSSLNNGYVHVLDDDTIPPINALEDLYSKLESDDGIGMTSGFYFCKNWHTNSAIKGAHESKRKITASIQKRKWISCTIDDFIFHNTTEVGFVGNGCILSYSNLLKNTLPLNDESITPKYGPDLLLSQRIRRQGKKIFMVPSIICKHLNEEGEEVGLTSEIINQTKKSTKKPKTVYISMYDSFLNYVKLSKYYDEIHILHRKFPSIFVDLKEIMYITTLNKIPNIKFIERDFKKYIDDYNVFNLKKFQSHVLTEYCSEYTNKNFLYNIHIQTSRNNIITDEMNKSLNSINFQNYLNN
tara:strand:+ start:1750 stop:2982 length:1233 start_codon:yes stop_codon:yes gene_type:complete